MEAVAKLRNCPTSPRKMRLVVDMIRGKKVEDALNILRFNNRKMYALYVEKLLKSAIANWGQVNQSTNFEDLVVKTVFVDGGMIAKRMQPAPQGRGYKIRKRSNHITLVVDTKVQTTVETQSN
jgi:large subunit ribosomal protein L22